MRDFNTVNDHRLTLSMGTCTARDVLTAIAREYRGTWIVRHLGVGLTYGRTQIGLSSATVLFVTASRSR